MVNYDMCCAGYTYSAHVYRVTSGRQLPVAHGQLLWARKTWTLGSRANLMLRPGGALLTFVGFLWGRCLRSSQLTLLLFIGPWGLLTLESLVEENDLSNACGPWFVQRNHEKCTQHVLQSSPMRMMKLCFHTQIFFRI